MCRAEAAGVLNGANIWFRLSDRPCDGRRVDRSERRLVVTASPRSGNQLSRLLRVWSPPAAASHICSAAMHRLMSIWKFNMGLYPAIHVTCYPSNASSGRPYSLCDCDKRAYASVRMFRKLDGLEQNLQIKQGLLWL